MYLARLRTSFGDRCYLLLLNAVLGGEDGRQSLVFVEEMHGETQGKVPPERVAHESLLQAEGGRGPYGSEVSLGIAKHHR